MVSRFCNYCAFGLFLRVALRYRSRTTSHKRTLRAFNISTGVNGLIDLVTVVNKKETFLLPCSDLF